MLIFVCMQCLFLLFGSVWRKPKNEHFGFTAAVFDSHTHLNASMFYQLIKLKEKVVSIRWSIEMLNVFVMNLYVVCGVCVAFFIWHIDEMKMCVSIHILKSHDSCRLVCSFWWCCFIFKLWFIVNLSELNLRDHTTPQQSTRTDTHIVVYKKR